jgi:hypothetical protein
MYPIILQLFFMCLMLLISIIYCCIIISIMSENFHLVLLLLLLLLLYYLPDANFFIYLFRFHCACTISSSNAVPVELSAAHLSRAEQGSDTQHTHSIILLGHFQKNVYNNTTLMYVHYLPAAQYFYSV